MSGSNCCFLTCIHVSQEVGTVVGTPISWRIFHSLLWSAQSKCSQFNEVDGFSGIPWFSYDPADVGNLICGSSAFPKSNLYICKFSVHVLLKPSLKDLGHYLASMWNECNCVVIWTFFDIALLWDWNENWPFPVLWPLLSFLNLLAYWLQHFNSSWAVTINSKNLGFF